MFTSGQNILFKNKILADTTFVGVRGVKAVFCAHEACSRAKLIRAWSPLLITFTSWSMGWRP